MLARSLAAGGTVEFDASIGNNKLLNANAGGIGHATQGLTNALLTNPFGFINVNSGGLLLVDGVLTNSSKINMSGSTIINYDSVSPLSAIAAQVHSGFANGSWNGVGINSTQAFLIASNPSNLHKTAVGYADASELGVGTFAGQSVDQTALLLRYTYSGDANLDGAVDTNDFVRLANHFGSTTISQIRR